MRRLLLGALILALGVLAAAHSGPARAQTVTVLIQNFQFNPAIVNITVGESVTWINQDPVMHTTTADAAVWDSGPLNSGQSFTWTSLSPGQFSYHCNIHPNMRGTVFVQAQSGTPTVTATPTVTPTIPGGLQPPPPPPPPGATNTPTATATPTATFTPTATATPVPDKLYFQIKGRPKLHASSTLQVTIRETVNHAVVSGAKVTLDARSAGVGKKSSKKTNGKGQVKFTFTPSRSGSVKLTATKSGYTTGHKTLRVAT